MRYGTTTLQFPQGYAQEPPHDFFGIHARCVSRDTVEGFLIGNASVVALTWWWRHKAIHLSEETYWGCRRLGFSASKRYAETRISRAPGWMPFSTAGIPVRFGSARPSRAPSEEEPEGG